jgi:hypothetical protein
MTSRIVTQADIDAALMRVERGESNKDDANMIRAWLMQLEARADCAEGEEG